MIKPVTDWASSYEELFFSKIDNPTTNPKVSKALDPKEQPLLWGKWVHQNTQGIAGAPPFAATATAVQTNFPPVLIPAPGTPPTTAAIIASAWMAYINAIVWAPPPPVPPFSAITLVTTSPLGSAAAMASLLAALTAEFALPMAPGEAGNKIKALGVATAFYTATLSAGIMVTGLSLPSPVPVPLVIPLLPAL